MGKTENAIRDSGAIEKIKGTDIIVKLKAWLRNQALNPP
jgi:hypothetical protein